MDCASAYVIDRICAQFNVNYSHMLCPTVAVRYWEFISLYRNCLQPLLVVLSVYLFNLWQHTTNSYAYVGP